MRDGRERLGNRRFWCTVPGAVTLVLLSALAGLLAAHVLGPSNAEVRAAVVSLTPPGVTVLQTGSGKVGDFPPPGGPYHAGATVSGGGQTHAERVATFRRHAEEQGWQLKTTANRPNAAVLIYERQAITAEVALLASHPTTGIDASRSEDATTARRLRGVAIGAAACLAGWALLRRRCE